jgi:hypothetical protein
MGGAGCCDNKAFGAPCAECADLEAELSRANGCPTCSGKVDLNSPANQAVRHGLAHAGAQPGLSDYWKSALVAEHVRRAALPMDDPETVAVREYVKAVQTEASTHGGSRLGAQFSAPFFGGEDVIFVLPLDDSAMLDDDAPKKDDSKDVPDTSSEEEAQGSSVVQHRCEWIR